MTAKKNEQYEKSSDWKNWLVFINNTHKKLDVIEEEGAKAYFDKRFLNSFFAKLKMFITVRNCFIEHFKVVNKELDRVGDSLFSLRYLEDYSSSNRPVEVGNFQYKAMKKLNKILEYVSMNFSDSELIPKVKKKWKKQQSDRLKGVSI